MFGDRLGNDALQETLEVGLRQVRQQHAAVRGALSRYAGAWLERHGDQLQGADSRHAHQLVMVQYARREGSPSAYARRYSEGCTMRGKRADCR